MKHTIRLGAVLWVAAACLTLTPVARAQQAGGAGTPFKDSRRSVKRGNDADSGRVNAKPVPTTVEKLLEQPRPLDLGSNEPNPDYEQKRAEPVETTVWEIEAEVVAHQLMPDGDYRLVLRGATGRNIIMEVPDPKLVAGSRFAKEIATVRKQIEERYHPTAQLQEGKGRMRVAAVGFFGRPAPKNAPNNLSGVQLHPPVKLEWLPDVAPKATGEKAKG